MVFDTLIYGKESALLGSQMKRYMSIFLFLIIFILEMEISIPIANGNEDVEQISSLKIRFDGGTGAIDDPYQISNIDQLQTIRDDMDAHYILINNIDASTTSNWNWNGTRYDGFIPIGKDLDPSEGFQGTQFNGTFDGNDFTISKLYISNIENNFTGLFACIGEEGSVKNIYLSEYIIHGRARVGGLSGINNGLIDNCRINGEIVAIEYLGGLVGINNGIVVNSKTSMIINGSDIFGGLIGENYKSGKVKNCSSDVVLKGEDVDIYRTLMGNNFIGGLIGIADGRISNCTSSGSMLIYDGWNCGGLVGANNGDIEYCDSFCDIIISTQFKIPYGESIGGLVGYNVMNITFSSFNGKIDSYRYDVGGLVGINRHDVMFSYSLGEVSGRRDVGGLIGTQQGHTKNCYSMCDVSGEDSIGGLIGAAAATVEIKNCYSSGKVTGIEDEEVGGLIGSGKFANVTSSFWDIQTSRMSTSEGGVGKTTSEMMTKSTFADAGWDFNTIWDMEEGKTYPYLRWQINDRLKLNIETPDFVGPALEDDAFSYDLNISGDRQGSLTWEMVSNATWLSIDPISGEIFGTPGNEDVGWCWVNVTVEDVNDRHGWCNLTITVENVNDGPKIITAPPPLATEDALYSYDVDASDDDTIVDPGEVLSFGLDEAPDNMTIDAETGLITWTPTNDQADMEHTAIVNVTDGEAFDNQAFTVGVKNVNDPPVILQTSPESEIEVNELYDEQFEATDPDPTQDEFYWDVDSDAQWLDMSRRTGELSGTPSRDDLGEFEVSVTVLDGNGGVAFFNFTITVLAPNDDQDIDGIPDDEDAFPTDPAASVDSDSDGMPDFWNDGFGPEDSTSDPPLVIDMYPDDQDNEATDDDDDDDDSTDDDDADDDDTGSSGSDGSNMGMLLIIGLVAAIAIVAFLFFGKKKEPVGKLEESDDESED